MPDDEKDFLSILRNAIEMEIEGKSYFERAAESMSHQRAKDTFISLSKQEQRHIDVLGEELKRLEDGVGWASLQEMKSRAQAYPKISVFQDKEFKHIKVRPQAGELEILQLGMEIEKRSIEYYRSAGSATSNPNAKEIFNWLVGEEAGHLTILTAEYEYRTRSGFYYDTMEFSLEVM